jgi:hypothetical protein
VSGWFDLVHPESTLSGDICRVLPVCRVSEHGKGCLPCKLVSTVCTRTVK